MLSVVFSGGARGRLVGDNGETMEPYSEAMTWTTGYLTIFVAPSRVVCVVLQRSGARRHSASARAPCVRLSIAEATFTRARRA